MYTNTDEQVDITILEESELGTFLHEWIHFIQDLATSFGCYNAYVFFETFLELVQIFIMNEMKRLKTAYRSFAKLKMTIKWFLIEIKISSYCLE